MTTTQKKRGQVYRLVDLLVEEVSLVDRAANKHHFLLVKKGEMRWLNSPKI